MFGITALLFYPLIRPQLGGEIGKRRAFRLFSAWSWMMRVLCLYFVWKKKNSLLPEGPYIIIANHASYLDIFLMHSLMGGHPFLFLGKSEILSYPLIRAYFKQMNIPVDRSNTMKSARAFVTAAKEAKRGWSLVIFPEGGIPDQDHPRMVPFKDGAFQLAKSLNIPIVPITFTNNYRLFSDPSNILGPARPGMSHVYIHEYIPQDVIRSLSQNELKERCFAIINEPLLATHPHLEG